MYNLFDIHFKQYIIKIPNIVGYTEGETSVYIYKILFGIKPFNHHCCK